MAKPDAPSVDEIERKLTVATYELNLLLRLAATTGLVTSVDTAERKHYTEIIVMVSRDGR